MFGFGGRTASCNTVFATLAKMEAIGTRRKYLEHYTKPYAGAARPCADYGVVAGAHL